MTEQQKQELRVVLEKLLRSDKKAYVVIFDALTDDVAHADSEVLQIVDQVYAKNMPTE